MGKKSTSSKLFHNKFYSFLIQSFSAHLPYCDTSHNTHQISPELQHWTTMAAIRNARKCGILALEEQRISEILEAEQLARDCETDPTFRHEMQLEGQRQLERQRDAAFENMQYQFLVRLRGFADHKQYWAWYKQAKMELQQLRETERLEREHGAQETDIFPLLRNTTLSPQSRKAYGNRIQPYPPDRTAEILPITTPEAFRLQHPPPQPRPWFRFDTEKKVSTKVEPPGKRFSAREMPRFRCNVEHYTWIQKRLRLSF